jgi:hemerythrin
MALPLPAAVGTLRAKVRRVHGARLTIRGYGMKRIEWTEDLRVNIGEIDAQHQRIITMIQTLDAAWRRGDRSVLLDVLRELVDYTREHFAAEEKYMDRFLYDGYDAHVEQHMECSLKATEFYGEYLGGNEDLMEEVLEYLTQWFLNHISGTDKKLGAYLNGQGVR